LKLRLVSARIFPPSSTTCSGRSREQPYEPSPPAFDTAATSCGVDAPAIGAWITGSSMSSRSSRRRVEVLTGSLR
jgi:hypothetical protein